MTSSVTKNPASPRGSDATRLKIYSDAASANRSRGYDAALKVIERAVERGDINERQGKNIVKLVEVDHAIRRYSAPTPIADDQGNMLGEIREMPDGRWRAMRYGPEVRTGGIIVADANAAVRHVRAETPSE